MERRYYRKPEMMVVIVPDDICEDGFGETRVVTHSGGPDIWIKEGGTQAGLSGGGWSWSKKSLWDDEEEELPSDGLDE